MAVGDTAAAAAAGGDDPLPGLSRPAIRSGLVPSSAGRLASMSLVFGILHPFRPGPLNRKIGASIPGPTVLRFVRCKRPKALC